MAAVAGKHASNQGHYVQKSIKKMDQAFDKVWNARETSSFERFSKVNVDQFSFLDSAYSKFEHIFLETQNRTILTSFDLMSFPKTDYSNFSYEDHVKGIMSQLVNQLEQFENVV